MTTSVIAQHQREPKGWSWRMARASQPARSFCFDFMGGLRHSEETHTFPTAPSPTTTHLMVCMLAAVRPGLGWPGMGQFGPFQRQRERAKKREEVRRQIGRLLVVVAVVVVLISPRFLALFFGIEMDLAKRDETSGHFKAGLTECNKVFNLNSRQALNLAITLCIHLP